MAYNRIITQTFNSSGTWLCPAGVTEIIVLGMGGGSGGAAAYDPTISPQAGQGGMGGALVPIVLAVTPNTTYTITVGAGGVGGVVTPVVFPNPPGGAGGDSSFGALVVFPGKKMSNSVGSGGNNYPVNTGVFTTRLNLPSTGGFPILDTRLPINADNQSGGSGQRGYAGKIGVSPTAGSPNSSLRGQGGSGGMSGEGPGGNGGAGTTAVNGSGSNGLSAAANTGAGGGGGGGANGSGTAGNGGDGGSGQIVVMWAE